MTRANHAARRRARARHRGLFVTGTDTGVGKTLVACALLRALRARGVDAAGMKPVETGVGARPRGDAEALRAAAGDGDPLERVCPQRFALPAAPAAAAAAEGRSVDLTAIRAAFAWLAARHDCVIVEGAGGLLVPLSRSRSIADLARGLALPLLVVARARLGTINHTLLTLEAAAARGLEVAGVVFCHSDRETSAADRQNLELLRPRLGRLWRGEIPHLGRGSELPRGCLDFEGIAAAAGVTLA